MAFLSVINKLHNPPINNEIPASNMALMCAGPINLYKKLMPPNAAIICGITMNILNKPIIIPILLGFTELDSMA